MVALYAGGGPARIFSPAGTAGAVQGFRALSGAIYGARLSTALAGDIVFRVDDFPDEEVLAALGMQDPFELTGLYQGLDLSQRSVMDLAPEPARVFLYRRPLLDEWAERGDVTLAELVAHVLIHEIGHHMGLSDEQIDLIEAG